MSSKLEQIDLLRERANVSYQDAKDALEKCNYDIVEALIYLEKENKVKPSKKDQFQGTFIPKVKALIKKGNVTRFVIKKNENTVLNIPVTIAFIVTITAIPFALAAIVLALFTSHRIRIEKMDGEGLKVNKVFDKISNTVDDIAKNLEETVKSE